MKLFDFLTNQKNKISFQCADLTETTQKLLNPDRGMYQIFPYVPGEEIDYEEISNCLLPTESLVLLMIDIGSLPKEALSEETLAQIAGYIRFFADAGKDLIVRVVYDRAGKGMEKEPGLFAIVSTHMEQLAALLAQFELSLFIYQGALVGNWGEMHGSKYLDGKHLGCLYTLLQERLHGEIFFGARKPAHLREVLKSDEPLLAAKEHFCLFDDAYLGSDNDLGTFGDMTRSKEEDISYATALGCLTPCGGEAVWGDGYAANYSADDTVQYLSRLHVSYLNRYHDLKLLDTWKEKKYRGQNLYDYIESHLGYRYHVKLVRGKNKTNQNGEAVLHLVLQIQNLGFAPIYRETESEIWIEDSNGAVDKMTVSLPLKEIYGQSLYELPVEIMLPENGTAPYRIFLYTKRKRDGRVIRFANEQTENGAVYLGQCK